MKTIKGDLIDMFMNGDFDVIIHGCNCFTAMGAGIAAQIAKEIPAAASADKMFSIHEPKINKLSSFSSASVRRNNDTLGFVVNLYTQYEPGPNLDENALLLGFRKLSTRLHKDFKIGIPEIGCGIAGGDWDELGPKITEIMKEFDITHVEYEPKTKQNVNYK